jgi:hypothetical protein
VHEVVAPEELDAALRSVVDALLHGGPAAQSAAKELIRAVDGQMINETLVEETAHRIAHLRGHAGSPRRHRRLPGQAAPRLDRRLTHVRQTTDRQSRGPAAKRRSDAVKPPLGAARPGEFSAGSHPCLKNC